MCCAARDLVQAGRMPLTFAEKYLNVRLVLDILRSTRQQNQESADTIAWWHDKNVTPTNDALSVVVVVGFRYAYLRALRVARAEKVRLQA